MVVAAVAGIAAGTGEADSTSDNDLCEVDMIVTLHTSVDPKLTCHVGCVSMTADKER